MLNFQLKVKIAFLMFLIPVLRISAILYVYLIGHSPSGLFRTNANNDKLLTRLRILTGGRQTSWLFKSGG